MGTERYTMKKTASNSEQDKMIQRKREERREKAKKAQTQGGTFMCREQKNAREQAREIVEGEKEEEGAGHQHRQKKYREGKPKENTAAWERDGAKGGPRMQKRGDRASPRAQDSPQLLLSLLPGDCHFRRLSLHFLLHNSSRLAFLHLRKTTHFSQLSHDEVP